MPRYGPEGYERKISKLYGENSELRESMDRLKEENERLRGLVYLHSLMREEVSSSGGKVLESSITKLKDEGYLDSVEDIEKVEKIFEESSLTSGAQKVWDEIMDPLYKEREERRKQEEERRKQEDERLSLEQMKELVEVPGKKYSIGKYQVTQALWESVMGNNPSDFKGSTRPVETVGWFDCVLFCNQLSEQEGLEEVYTLPDDLEGLYKELIQQRKNLPEDEIFASKEEEEVYWAGIWELEEKIDELPIDELSIEVSQNLEANGYRLPTDWEWWFAAKSNQDFEYSGSDNFDEVAWTEENSNDETHGVGQKKPNGFGLYDMSGNVGEWCWDWFEGDHEGHIPTEDSTGPSTGSDRVLRGGSWCDNVSGGSWIDGPNRARVSYRTCYYPSYYDETQGFRFTRTIR